MRRKGNKSALRWQALTSTISTTMVLVLLGILVLFVLTAKELRDSVREDLTVTLVLRDGVTNEEGHKIEKNLQRQRYVHDINYISSEQALREQVDAMGIDPSEFLGANPFTISMELRMKAEYACTDSLKWIARELRHDSRITDVIYQKDMIETLNSNLNRISLILLVVTVLLSIVSLSLINNTVRMSVYSRRFIINTMKLVGAKWSFIRRPFMIRSMWIGIISALIADCILAGGIEWMLSYDADVMQFIPTRNIWIMAGSVLAFGLIITLLCTFVSVTHYLRMRESDLYK